MATDSPSKSQSTMAALGRQLLTADVYKRNHGRRIRYVTSGAIVVLLLWGLYVLSEHLDVYYANWLAITVPAAIFAAGAWIAFRVSWGLPKFCDFLIATEAEMAKVSWSKKEELKQATIVVLVLVLIMAGYLLFVDMTWSFLLRKLGVLLTPPETPDESALLIQPFRALYALTQIYQR